MAVAPGRRDPVAELLPAGRLRDMQRRVERRLERSGLAVDGRERVLRAHAAALLHRLSVLADDEHFDALHPSRTLLILLDDCAVTDVRVLEAAATVESEHASLRVAAANALAEAVPLPAAHPDLLEQLVVADEDVQLIALAERLDHARHLHLRDAADWVPFHALVEDVYAPVARRTHPRLGRRYDWWQRTFRRRFLDAKGARPRG